MFSPPWVLSRLRQARREVRISCHVEGKGCLLKRFLTFMSIFGAARNRGFVRRRFWNRRRFSYPLFKEATAISGECHVSVNSQSQESRYCSCRFSGRQYGIDRFSSYHSLSISWGGSLLFGCMCVVVCRSENKHHQRSRCVFMELQESLNDWLGGRRQYDGDVDLSRRAEFCEIREECRCSFLQLGE